jgi:DNA-binding CsgD family transcriptional regulator
MYRIYQNFIDSLAESTDATSLRESMADTIRALDLSCFAYLWMPDQRRASPQLISTYPAAWTSHYLENHYERFDPVVVQAIQDAEPFEWGVSSSMSIRSHMQRKLFEEATEFGICHGFTVPIHDSRGPIAAVTFATDDRRSGIFRRRIREHGQVLQLMAMYFHAHAWRRLACDRVIGGVSLSPREFECLKWAARGKSAWEIGQILGISRHTVATHLQNSKSKLGVRTIVQAVARLTASKLTMR